MEQRGFQSLKGKKGIGDGGKRYETNVRERELEKDEGVWRKSVNIRDEKRNRAADWARRNLSRHPWLLGSKSNDASTPRTAPAVDPRQEERKASEAAREKMAQVGGKNFGLTMIRSRRVHRRSVTSQATGHDTRKRGRNEQNQITPSTSSNCTNSRKK